MAPGFSQSKPGEELTCADKLKVLADKTRLAVMEFLMEGPSYVEPLAEATQVEQSLLSHHLKVLRAAGLVVADRDGKAVLYRISPDTEVTSYGKAIDLGCCQLHFEPDQRGVTSRRERAGTEPG